MVHAAKNAGNAGKELVRIDQVSVDFGRQRVLRDISLSVPRGQTLAIIGESGCGKTVLLKTVIGLLMPTRGAVHFDGEDLAKLSEKQLTRKRICFGFVFQQAALFDSMTVAQNVAFPLRQHPERRDDVIKDRHPEAVTKGRELETVITDIVRERLREVGLADESVLVKKPAELSGGMRKRVGLARALALEPEILLYDEPTTGLDPIMGDVINKLIVSTRQRRPRDKPVTGIVVTHDMRTARETADRVVMLYPLSRLREDEPQILYDGPPDEIEQAADPRVTQFVRGEAGERITE